MAEVLVVGNGGREAALAQALMASPEVGLVQVDSDVSRAIQIMRKPDLVVIGPEAPLVEGLADDLRKEGITVFGAGKEAAQYEASKSRATRMAQNAGVLVPATYIAEGANMADMARSYIENRDPRDYVIKADGLAGGKGVVLPESREEARETIEGMIAGTLFGGAGKEIINFQARHSGPEVSAMVVVGRGSDDFTILPLSQDHKRLLNGDKGPNTGGMGAYAPVPESIVSAAQYDKIWEKAHASLAGMEAEGVSYAGAVLYMGLMMSEGLEGKDENDSMLIEYNVRFGDPETQVILPLVQKAGVDVYRLLHSAAEGHLEMPDVDFANLGAAAVSVCLAADNYPGTPRTGDVIRGLDNDYGPNVVIQEAGVSIKDGWKVTAGGRVLYVTGVGEDIDAAAREAYAAIGPEAINFDNMQYRPDIGWQARQAA